MYGKLYKLSSDNSFLILPFGAIIITGTLQLIESRIIDQKLIYRINEIVASTLGKDFEKSFDIYFDYKFSVDSIQHYESVDIPMINISSIPSNINNVRFDCDLTDVRNANKTRIKSKLHNSMF